MKRFYCLMLSGLSLNEELADILYHTAYHMAEQRVGTASIRTPACEGRIVTAFKTVTFGGAGGMMFEAMLETESGRARVRFVADPEEEKPDDWRWISIPLEICLEDGEAAESAPLYN